MQVREFLVACRRHMPLLARQSMDAGMKFGAMMAGGAGADSKMLEQMEQHMGDYLPQVHPTVPPPAVGRRDSLPRCRAGPLRGLT